MKFSLGQLYATPGATKALEESGESFVDYIRRHAVGDWGELDSEDWATNEMAIVEGSRLLSAYTLKTGNRIWIITEATDEQGRRPCTTVLLPEEY